MEPERPGLKVYLSQEDEKGDEKTVRKDEQTDVEGKRPLRAGVLCHKEWGKRSAP
jgi:hypothetical protein